MKQCIVIMAWLALNASAQAQTLADVARQERERTRNIQSTIILTNDSVRTGVGASLNAGAAAPAAPAADPAADLAPAPAAAPAAANSSTAETPGASATGPTDRQGRDEKYWRDAFQQARQDLARAQNEVRVAEIKLNQANRDLLVRSDIFNREQQIGAQINAARAELETARRNVEGAQQKIVLLEEDLRRSGGPPGWAR